MKGILKINGKSVAVDVQIKDGELILQVGHDTDTTNWYHAVTIERRSKPTS